MEVVGVAAGVAALAQLVGQTVLELVGIWEKMRDAPQKLRDLTDEIRGLSRILADVDSELSHIHGTSRLSNPSPSVQSAKYCRDALNALRTVVEELNREMRSATGFGRIIAATNVLREKRLIDRLEHRLEKALRRLELAIQCHSLWVIAIDVQLTLTDFFS